MGGRTSRKEMLSNRSKAPCVQLGACQQDHVPGVCVALCVGGVCVRAEGEFDELTLGFLNIALEG